MMKEKYIPQCEHPIVLVNAAALNYAALGFKTYTMLDRFMINRPVKKISKSMLYELLAKDSSLMDAVVRVTDDYSEPVFIYAPCGRCDLCHEKKVNDIVFRAAMESAVYDCPAYFFTLTYDPEHMPDNKQLRVSDVQKFFKRLRRNWDRKGLSHNIRYLIKGEYGSKRGRPHYHMIMWNNPYGASEMKPVEHRQLGEDVYKAWNKAQRQSYDYGQCRGGAAQYVAKYIGKDDVLHGHYIKPFILSSKKNGGIGSAVIDANREYLRANPRCRQVTFKDYNGNVVSVNFSAYITSRVWPSPVRMIPPKKRAAYRELCNLLSQIDAMDMADDALLSLADDLRPSKYIASQMSVQYDYEKPRCHMAAKRRFMLYLRAIDDCVQELAELVSPRDSEVMQYFDYKAIPTDIENKGYALRLSRLRQQNAIAADKAIF